LKDFMVRDYLFRALAGALLALGAPGTARGDPSLTVSPRSVRPGDVVLVTLRDASGPPTGRLAGRDLRFYPVSGGWQALAALPVETAPGALEVEVEAPPGAGGPAQPVRAGVEVVEPKFASAELGVAPRFLNPPPKARQRMEQDQAAFRKAFDQPFGALLFAAPFDAPREAEVTGSFGDQRVFNGKKRSQHYGEDLAGAVGEPVRAANDGRVVLARDCYASGRSVVIWHGANLFSVYFHLSRMAVKAGDEIRRGQVLGQVGRTGRVTGPHLHWGTKVGDLYVDPRSVLRLTFAD
jgi:murein DD-endopeptidase MepM/ murein hydrolase activator NlpD